MCTLRAPQIQTVIQCERDDTPDQPEETYFFIAKWIHYVANEAENTQLALRGCQWYAHSRAEAHLLRPWLEVRIALFCVPIGSMLWVTTTHSIPQGQQVFYRRVRKR
jgi:hypothetical protein